MASEVFTVDFAVLGKLLHLVLMKSMAVQLDPCAHMVQGAIEEVGRGALGS